MASRHRSRLALKGDRDDTLAALVRQMGELGQRTQRLSEMQGELARELAAAATAIREVGQAAAEGDVDAAAPAIVVPRLVESSFCAYSISPS